MIRSYRDLDVWKLAMQLAEDACRLIDALPRQETYGLGAQIQRSAVSIASNIAEGHARSSGREYSRFPSIAMASLAELETQLLLATRIHGLEVDSALSLADRLGRMLRVLHQSIDRKIAARESCAPQPQVPSP